MTFPTFSVEVAEGEPTLGQLIAVEHNQLPFTPQRTFTITGVQPGVTRGEHAHKQCEQLLLCVSGTITVYLDDGSRTSTNSLEQPGDAIFIPAMVWGHQIYSGTNATVVVFASHPYSRDDYIDDYADFLHQKMTEKPDHVRQT